MVCGAIASATASATATASSPRTGAAPTRRGTSEIDELRDATRDADFMTWGESYDLDDAQTQVIEDALRFERGMAKTRDVTLMRYRPNEPDAERIADIVAPAATRV